MMTVVPEALPALPERHAGVVRVAWFGILVVAVAVQLFGTAFAVRNAYHTQPAFLAFGLSSAIEYDGGTTVSSIGREGVVQHIAEGSHIVAIEGHVLPPRANAAAIAAQMRAAPARIIVRLRDPKGRISDHRLTRSPEHYAEAQRQNPISLTVRMAARFLFALLSMLALIGSAILLYRRRPEDPEAVLISFTFLLMALVIDPPILLWMGLGLTAVIDGVTGLWWTLIIIAFAAFPSGRFEPTWLRWSIVGAPALGLLLALDLQSTLVSILIGVVPPIAILTAQIHRYRAIAPGIERQQIKWAGFGFAAGFVVLGLSLGLAELADRSAWSPSARSALNLAVVCMFSASFTMMPLGLLVALLRYRLWEADMVIRRSANYAALTLVVGFAFTLASDVAKAIISALLGSEHAVIATAVGAIAAVSIFTPARSYVLRWSKERYDKPMKRLQDLPDQLAVWRQSEEADELGTRILATIVEGMHAEYAALFALTPTGRELVASNNIFDPQALAFLRRGNSDGLAWQEVRTLHDDGPVGTLMLGRRSDHNRFNRTEREALDSAVAPIAKSLRMVRQRTRSDRLRDLEARLARLEGSGAGLRQV